MPKSTPNHISLIPCGACGKEISHAATACPSCGHPNKPPEPPGGDTTHTPKPKKKKSSSHAGCLFLVVIIIMGLIIVANNDSSSVSNNSPTITRQEQVERAFSSWDGSHRQLTAYIKARLKDPKSYEHDETTFADKGDYVLVRTVYRARNGFGGMSVNSMTAKCKTDGSIIEIIE